MNTGIYKITNPKGKIYVGQSVNIKRRFTHYKNLKEIKSQKKIYYSIKKYGYDQHKFEILEICNRDELNEKEKHWIKFYDCCNTGLNISDGGEGSFGKLNKGKKRSSKTKKKISETKRLNPRKTTLEMINNFREISPNKKEIFQYDLDGNFIRKYPSINEAARHLNIRNDGISACVRGKQTTAYKYQWFYTFQENVPSVKPSQKPKHWTGPRKKEIDEKLPQIISLHKQGKNLNHISNKLNIHRDAIKLRIKEFNKNQ
jgi:hypothetical protein